MKSSGNGVMDPKSISRGTDQYRFIVREEPIKDAQGKEFGKRMVDFYLFERGKSFYVEGDTPEEEGRSVDFESRTLPDGYRDATFDEIQQFQEAILTQHTFSQVQVGEHPLRRAASRFSIHDFHYISQMCAQDLTGRDAHCWFYAGNEPKDDRTATRLLFEPTLCNNFQKEFGLIPFSIVLKEPPPFDAAKALDQPDYFLKRIPRETESTSPQQDDYFLRRTAIPVCKDNMGQTNIGLSDATRAITTVQNIEYDLKKDIDRDGVLSQKPSKDSLNRPIPLTGKVPSYLTEAQITSLGKSLHWYVENRSTEARAEQDAAVQRELEARNEAMRAEDRKFQSNETIRGTAYFILGFSLLNVIGRILIEVVKSILKRIQDTGSLDDFLKIAAQKSRVWRVIKWVLDKFRGGGGPKGPPTGGSGSGNKSEMRNVTPPSNTSGQTQRIMVSESGLFKMARYMSYAAAMSSAATIVASKTSNAFQSVGNELQTWAETSHDFWAEKMPVIATGAMFMAMAWYTKGATASSTASMNSGFISIGSDGIERHPHFD